MEEEPFEFYERVCQGYRELARSEADRFMVIDGAQSPDAIEQVVLEAKYAGYIDRQAAQVERFHRLESRPIPASFDYAALPQLRFEAREKLGRIRPTSLGQASRISGICPADLAVLLTYLGSSCAD